MIIYKIILAIANCFYIYGWLICIRCLLTWIPGLDWSNPVLKLIASGTDVYLDLFRKIIPPVGPFDFSPVVAMFALFFLGQIVCNGFIFIVRILGIG
jgi:YggT family protein